MSAARTPCKTCPWRVAQHADEIPGFQLEMAEGLTGTTTGEFGAPMMACHQSDEGKHFVCAGWLARHGQGSVTVRMVLGGMLSEDQINGTLKGVTVEGLEPGKDWPEIHADYPEVLDKLREDCA